MPIQRCPTCQMCSKTPTCPISSRSCITTSCRQARDGTASAYRASDAVSRVFGRSVFKTSTFAHLYDSGANHLGEYTLTLAPAELIQDLEPFKRRANRSDLGWGFAKVEVVSGSGVLCSASVVDSMTNDATTVPFKR